MKTLKILALIATASATGCAGITDPLAEDQILLEIEYINFAWTPTYFGFIVDGSGRVFRYDRKGEPWNHQDLASYTPAMLADKFVPMKNQVDARAPSEVASAAAKIEAAAGGSLSEPRMVCADAGTLTYRAYDHDPGTGRLTPVLLRMEGDRARQNTSAAAQELIAYIRSLNLLEELPGCDP